MTGATRLERRQDRWQITTAPGAATPPATAGLTLGSCACRRTALRVWLAVLAQEGRL